MRRIAALTTARRTGVSRLFTTNLMDGALSAALTENNKGNKYVNEY